MNRIKLAILLGLGSLLVGCNTGGDVAAPAGAPNCPAPPPEIGNAIPWRCAGRWLTGESHVHHMFRDRSIVEEASESGLDYVASTDHPGEFNEDFSRERFAEMRKQYPRLIILAGYEWNVPAGDHACLIVEEDDREQDLIFEFAELFDRDINDRLKEEQDQDITKASGSLEDFESALSWLADERRPRSVVYLNHLARKNGMTPDDIERLARGGLGGVEASPGHQRVLDRQPTLDRFDPFVAEIGGGYDRVMRSAHLGIIASSDFHVPETAYYPGTFSTTLVHCPDRSAAGVVAGMKRGATVAVTGGIIRAVETSARLDDGTVRALMSETLKVPAGRPVVYELRLDVPKRDKLGHPNRLDEVEVIADYGGDSRVVHRFGPVEPGKTSLAFALPADATASPGTFLIRARGRQRVGVDDRHDVDNADLMFYTSATRVEVIPENEVG